MSTAKRLFYYLLSLISLSLAAAGAGILLSLMFNMLFGNQGSVIRDGGFNAQQLSLGLALLIIGGGLWWFFWRLIRQSVSADPFEIGTTVRKFYLNLILTVTAITALIAATQFLTELLGGFQTGFFPSGSLSTLLVAGAIWLFHWQVSEKEGHPSRSALTLRRWYVYILSGWGLVALASGLVQFLNGLIIHLPLWRPVFVEPSVWGYDVRSSLSTAVIGGVAWSFHWLYMAGKDRDSTLRQVYLYLLAVSGGAIAALVALITLIFQLLRFMFGGSGSAGASYFIFLGWTVPLLLVAFGIWLYHERITREEAAGIRLRRLSAQRVHVYLMSFIALGTLVGGLIMLCSVLIDIPLNQLTGPIIVSPGWWHEPLSLSLALLFVGVPLWLYYWKQAMVLLERDRPGESRARSRRIFLYVVLGISINTLAADLVIIIYQLLRGILEGLDAAEILRGLKWGLQTMVVAVPVLLYFWRTLRQDQRAGAEALARHKQVSVILPEGTAAFMERLEEILGYRVKELRSLLPAPADYAPPGEDEIRKLAEEIRLSGADKAVLVLAGSKWLFIPYQD
jgi:hypothetical protein